MFKCLFRKHRWNEIDRYLLFTGEDRVFYKCEHCGKEKEDFTLETAFGYAKAPDYKEWEKERTSKIKNKL